MEKAKKYYAYSIEMKGMTTALLVVAIALFGPLIIFSRDIIIEASSSPFFVVAIAFWFVLHEIIHGLSYRMSSGIGNQDIVFGAKLEKGVLFCVCKKPISKKDTIRSLLTPLVILGFATLILGVAFHSDLLIVLSLMNICGASGDILMALFIAGMPKDVRFFEDEQNRFVLVTGENISKRTAVGVKLEEIGDDYEKVLNKNTKKIIISKGSCIIIGVICLYTVLCILQVF